MYAASARQYMTIQLYFSGIEALFIFTIIINYACVSKYSCGLLQKIPVHKELTLNS